MVTLDHVTECSPFLVTKMPFKMRPWLCKFCLFPYFTMVSGTGDEYDWYLKHTTGNIGVLV